MSLLAQLGLSLALALVCAAVPWLARWLGAAWLLGLLLGMLLATALLARPLTLYPWSDLVVAALALLGGMLLGRVLPPRFPPMLILLLILSALDVAQSVLTSGSPPPGAASHAAQTSAPGWFALFNFVIRLPAGRYRVGGLDLLIITALAEHWRRRGVSYPLAMMPGALGFALAYGFVWLAGTGGLPLIPFFTAGWLCAEAAHRLAPRQRNALAG